MHLAYWSIVSGLQFAYGNYRTARRHEWGLVNVAYRYRLLTNDGC